jgi:protein-tyrosine phosphatase
MTKIRPNLYIGSRHDASFKSLTGTPITVVFNLTPDVPETGGGYRTVRVAMHDTAEDVHGKTDEAVKRLNALLDAGETVLVHCRQGKSRTPHIVAECLAIRENRDYFAVYEEIRKLRPEVLWYSIGQEIVDKHRRGQL